MLDVGYLLAPGALFHAERQPSTLMRINFATTQDAKFWETFERIRAERCPQFCVNGEVGFSPSGIGP